MIECRVIYINIRSACSPVDKGPLSSHIQKRGADVQDYEDYAEVNEQLEKM
jgi:hypothetical protein